MKLADKRKALMQGSKIGKKIFNKVGLVLSQNGGSVEVLDDGIIFSSTSAPTWFLYAQSTGEAQDFELFKNLRYHRLRVEADIEWLNRPERDGSLIISVGFYNSTDGARAYRARYRDIGFNSQSEDRHITDEFISDYDAYPGGGMNNLDYFYFMFRIFFNCPPGGVCKLKNFNVYDLGEEMNR